MSSSIQRRSTKYRTTLSEIQSSIWLRRCFGICLFFIYILIRYLVSLHPYSGESTPPMYGDYEAQRHWMEITTNIPISSWYTQTDDNDLQYWGLDYPPLSAYLAFILGKLAEFSLFDQAKLVALHSSRGFEDETSRLFMRWSVILLDVLLFFPAIYYFCWSHFKERKQSVYSWGDYCLIISLLLMSPSLLLIDHGHFQYNTVSLVCFQN